jgi:hypothetical protein
MPFDPSTVTNLTVRPDRDSGQVLLTWTYSGAAPTPLFQVYQDGRLARRGSPGLSCPLPWPSGPARYDVGEVQPGEEDTDYSALLDPTPAGPRRVQLRWWGGNYLDLDDDDVLGFRIYGEASAGSGIDFGRVLADIAAYPAGFDDGYGEGPYGLAYGSDASEYAWESAPLGGGTWAFAVRAYDRAGNELHAASISVTIAAPPNPPAPDAAGRRLTYTYDPGTGVATLHWLASP